MVTYEQEMKLVILRGFYKERKEQEKRKIITDLVEEFKEKDQEFLGTNYFQSYTSEQKGTIYSKLRKMHIEEAKKLYDEAWQIKTLFQMRREPDSKEIIDKKGEKIEAILKNGLDMTSKEIGDKIGDLTTYKAFAHEFLAQQYNDARNLLGEVDEKEWKPGKLEEKAHTIH